MVNLWGVHVKIRVTLDRWYLGLHGLAILRSYPFGDPKEASQRMQAMRALLEGNGEDWIFESREYETFEVHEAYERWAPRYDEPNPLIVAEEKVLLPILDAHPPGLAVDVAAGTGRVAAHLLRRGHRVFASDRSGEMISRAAERHPGLQLVQADLEDLPFASGTADLVACSLALTHVKTLAPAFGSFARVLRSGGIAVISDIHPFAVTTGAHAFFRSSDDTRAVTRNEEHSISDYITAALEAGFTIESCSEARVDAELLRDFDVSENPLDPERAVLGLPFALVWTLRR